MTQKSVAELQQEELIRLRERAERLCGKAVVSLPKQTPPDVEALVHELRVHEVELTLQFQELQRAHAETAESRDRYRELYESIPVGYVTIDADGRIYDMNPAGARLLGIDGTHLQLKRFFFFFFFCNGDVDAITLLCRKLLTHGEQDRREFTMKTMDDTRFTAALQVSPVEIGEGKGERLRVAFEDVTARKDAERAMQQYQAELEANRGELRRLASQLLSAQEEERQRIARELHDDYCQCIAAVLMEAGSLAKRCQASAPSLIPQVSTMRDMLTNLLDEFRYLSHELHPQNLSTLPLATNLRSLTREVSSHSGLQIEFHEQSVPHPMPMPIAISLYRVTQESLSNIRKHAKATTVVVKLVGAPGELRLLISDNGVGFENDRTAQACNGIGLTSMQERVRPLGGQVSILSRQGAGTTVTAVIPLSS